MGGLSSCFSPKAMLLGSKLHPTNFSTVMLEGDLSFLFCKMGAALRPSRLPTLGMAQPFLYLLQQTFEYQETQTN